MFRKTSHPSRYSSNVTLPKCLPYYPAILCASEASCTCLAYSSWCISLEFFFNYLFYYTVSSLRTRDICHPDFYILDFLAKCWQFEQTFIKYIFLKCLYCKMTNKRVDRWMDERLRRYLDESREHSYCSHLTKTIALSERRPVLDTE